MPKTAEQAVANWTAAMGSSSTATKYKQGIQNTQENPMQKAASADAQQKYAHRTAAAVTSGRMAAKLNAVPMERWRQNAMNQGVMALSAGAAKAKEKFTAAMQKQAPIWNQASQAAKAIPHDGSMSSAMERVRANMEVFMRAAGRA